MRLDPHIGRRFGYPNDIGLPERVLLIGDSHHGDTPAYPDLTRQVVRDVTVHGYRYRFFTRMFHAVRGPGAAATLEALRDFYESLAFANFIQEVRTGRGEFPTEQQWKRGEKAFVENLDQVRPTHSIVFGVRVWDRLPRHRFDACAAEIEAAGRQHMPDPIRNQRRYRDGKWIGRFRYAGGSCPIVGVRHPASYGFSAADWHPVLSWFLGRA